MNERQIKSYVLVVLVVPCALAVHAASFSNARCGERYAGRVECISVPPLPLV